MAKTYHVLGLSFIILQDSETVQRKRFCQNELLSQSISPRKGIELLPCYAGDMADWIICRSDPIKGLDKDL